jgi:hypothetical protein
VVVPEGAGLLGGGKVRWESVSNVTVEISLPNITLPDANTYAILSIMTNSGTVLQVAAGATPESSDWFAFAWSVSNVNSIPSTYQWILNASEPKMSPNGNVSLSIFQLGDQWNLKATNTNSGASVERPFPAQIAPTLKVGDQEVFALESYSRTSSTFENMGNLTMGPLLLNGQRVTSGFYTYAGWDPDHNPLFVVGSSGSNPPSFIYIGQGEEGSFYWNYAVAWGIAGNPLTQLVEVSVVVMLVVTLTVVGTTVWWIRKAARTSPGSRSRSN